MSNEVLAILGLIAMCVIVVVFRLFIIDELFK
jgi:hypothetical protein